MRNKDQCDQCVLSNQSFQFDISYTTIFLSLIFDLNARYARLSIFPFSFINFLVFINFGLLLYAQLPNVKRLKT